MTDLMRAAQQALEALAVATNCLDGYYIPRGKTTLPEIEDAIAALRAALAEPSTEESLAVETVQEPVRCPLCNYQYGHQIGCKNNPLDIALAAAAQSRQPAEPVQEPVEPVAYIHRQGRHWEVSERPLADDEKARGWTEEPLFTAPPQRKPLTDEEIERLWYPSAVIAEPGKRRVAFGRAIERAHGIGGQQ